MKLVVDEKLKHRLVGLAVILSLGTLFLPTMMKKSSQRFEHNFSVNVRLPPKPTAPNVVMTDKKEMFATMKVAKVEIPPVSDQKGSTLDKDDFTPLAQAVDVPKPTTTVNPVAAAKPVTLALLNNAVRNAAAKPKSEVLAKPVKLVKPAKVQARVVPRNVAPKRVIAKAKERRFVSQKDIYAVQLASFTKFANAQALVRKLQGQGYKANYLKTNGTQGTTYRVLAGHSPVKGDAMKVKTQLASAMQLNGFVVNTGVS